MTKPVLHQFIRDFLRQRCAIVLDANKGYLIESRLGPLCPSHDCADLGELVETLRKEPGGALAQDVIEALTTNETSFYRDPNCWRALREEVLPELIRRRARFRTLNIWSAAASTGQEAYSLAMILYEMPALVGWRVNIVATDIDERVLAHASKGEYSQLEVSRGLPNALLEKHLSAVGTAWRVRGHIRRMVTFEKLNLAQPWSRKETMDLVLMRNVLIYFDQATKRDVLVRVADILRPDGYLCLGGAETTLNITGRFIPVRMGRTTMYRLPKGAP